MAFLSQIVGKFRGIMSNPDGGNPSGAEVVTDIAIPVTDLGSIITNI